MCINLPWLRAEMNNYYSLNHMCSNYNAIKSLRKRYGDPSMTMFLLLGGTGFMLQIVWMDAWQTWHILKHKSPLVSFSTSKCLNCYPLFCRNSLSEREIIRSISAIKWLISSMKREYFSSKIKKS